MNVQLAQAKALLSKDRPNPDKAIKTLKPLLNKPNKHWLLYHYMGVAQLQKKDFRKAKAHLEDAFRYGGDEAETYHLMSAALYNLGEYEDALFHGKEAISRNDQLVESWVNLGASYRAIADLDNAMKAYSRANQLNPSDAGIAYRIGSIYFDQGDLKQARNLYEITKQVDPDYKEAYLGLCLIAQHLQDYETALGHVNEAIEKFPKYRLAKIQLAVVYKEMGRYSDAIEVNQKLLLDKPNDGRLRVNYALCLLETGQFNEAEKNYLRALRDTPEVGESLSNYLMGIHYNPERTKDEIFDAHLLWDKYYAPKVRRLRPVPKDLNPDKKLRVGFISGGFRKHPVGWMITSALEHLPKDQFEIYCYTTHSSYDNLTARISKSCDKWVSVLGYTDEVVSNMLQKDEVDILVELSGHSAFNRLKTVALEPAPITMKWVGGLFNTTGMQSMDYLLTDHFESPKGEEEYYTEKLVRMPDDYIVYVPPTYNIRVSELPAKYNNYITFGCFNNPSKLNKELLKEWADLLKSVPNSKLFLKSKQYDTPAFVEGVIDQMNKFGVEEDQLIFEGYAMHEDLLCSYNKVDIALDPWPYSGGLTTVESLWMGVPVVSNQGPTFAGKHSATHLSNAGHPESVVSNWDEYKAKVLELTSDLESLAKIRSGLREELLSSPVCDGARFGAHLSKAFREMWHQRVNGYKNELPEGEWQSHIDVKPISNEELEAFKMENGYDLIDPFTTQHKLIELEDGVQISVPLYKENFTRYVLEEQKQWIDNEVTFLKDVISEGDIVFDVGAGFGTYSLPLAQKIGENGCVFAFEPHHVMANHLKESGRINRFPQIEVVEKAVSDKNGISGFLHKGKEEDSVLSNELSTHQINTITLDEFWTEYGQPPVHLLKVDVNGSEAEVLKGGSTLIQAHHPLLVISEPTVSANSEIKEFISSQGYSLFELIPEIGILSEFNNNENPYRKNLIALTAQHVVELKQQRLIFEETEQNPEIVQGSGFNYLKSLPWSTSLKNSWVESPDNEILAMHFTALDAIATAQNLGPSKKVEKAHLLLVAATNLMQLHNANPGNTPISLTLARTLNLLGKRSDAVDMMQKLTHKLLTGQPVGDLSLPFFPPLVPQDNSLMYSNPETWIKVKVAEAWLLLKDLTTYTFTDSDIKYVKGLSGNPEVLPHINYLAEKIIGSSAIEPKPDLKKVEEGKFIHIIKNDEQAQALSALLANVNKTTEQQHELCVEGEASTNIGFGEDVTLFDRAEDMEGITAKCLSEDVDAVFVHGLFDDWQLKLIKSIGFNKHVGWVIRGADLYDPIEKKRPIRFLSNFIDSIHTTQKEHADIYKQEYGNIADFDFSYSDIQPLALASKAIIENDSELEAKS